MLAFPAGNRGASHRDRGNRSNEDSRYVRSRH